jgi:cell division protein FtsN
MPHNGRAACTTAGTAQKTDMTSGLREQLGVEEKLACSPGASSGRAIPTITPAPALPAAANTPNTKSSARYSIQFAAFSQPGNAAPVAEQLRRAGFDARVAYVEGNPLARVRIGRFETIEQARTEANRAKAAGFGGIIVDDVQKEKSQNE